MKNEQIKYVWLDGRVQPCLVRNENTSCHIHLFARKSAGKRHWMRCLDPVFSTAEDTKKYAFVAALKAK